MPTGSMNSGCWSIAATEATGFVQDAAGVTLALFDGSAMRGQYLVGYDGGRSLVRKAAGIEFPGSNPTTRNLIVEVEVITRKCTTSRPLSQAWNRSRTKIARKSLTLVSVGPVMTSRSMAAKAP